MLNTFGLGLGRSKTDNMAETVSPAVEKFLNENFKGLPGKEDSQNIIKETVEQVVKLPDDQKTPVVPPVQNQQQQQNTSQQQPAANQTTPAAEEKNNGTEGSGTAASQNQPATPPAAEKKSIFKPKAPIVDDLKYESVDDFKVIAKKYGVEIKEPKDFSKLTASFDKWRGDAQKVPDLEKKIEEIQAIIETVPAELFEGIKAYHTGQDWRKAIDNVKPFNIETPVEKQDIKTLVQHYYPNTFTEDDFAAKDKPKALEIAEQASKDKFVTEQSSFNTKRAGEVEKATKRLEAKTNSIEGSVGELVKSFPDLDDTVVNDVRNIMASGDILGEFVNRDGSFKPSAAKMLMLMKYGEQELTRLLEAGENRIESAKTEEIVLRGSDQPGTIKSGGKPQELSDRAKKVLDSINRIGEKTTY